MGIIEALERQVQDLSTEELAAFRRWFAAFDAVSMTDWVG